jgi:hypothetical protein
MLTACRANNVMSRGRVEVVTPDRDVVSICDDTHDLRAVMSWRCRIIACNIKLCSVARQTGNAKDNVACLGPLGIFT